MSRSCCQTNLPDGKRGYRYIDSKTRFLATVDRGEEALELAGPTSDFEWFDFDLSINAMEHELNFPQRSTAEKLNFPQYNFHAIIMRVNLSIPKFEAEMSMFSKERAKQSLGF